MSGQLSLQDFLKIELSQHGRQAYGWRLWDPRAKLVLSLLAKASLPIEQGPMANQDGQLGSLVDLSSSANVPQHQDEDLAVASGER